MCMKQISVEEKNPLTSSLNNCPEACYGKGYLPSWFVDIPFKDDVTAFDAGFMYSSMLPPIICILSIMLTVYNLNPEVYNGTLSFLKGKIH